MIFLICGDRLTCPGRARFHPRCGARSTITITASFRRKRTLIRQYVDGALKTARYDKLDCGMFFGERLVAAPDKFDYVKAD